MAKHPELPAKHIIRHQVRMALAEDLGSGDITAQLIPDNSISRAKVISRQEAVLCGQVWFDEVFHQLNADIAIDWHYQEGSTLAKDSCVVTLQGNTRALLSGERAALNFLQTLSATATTTADYCSYTHRFAILDTRKTIPGLRHAQKYAVRCGGGKNHRMGLDDSYLIKENHLAAMGGDIANIVHKARRLHPSKLLIVEVVNLKQLQQALHLPIDIVLLDNFNERDMIRAVEQRNQAGANILLEVSGNIEKKHLKRLEQIGVDRVSIGALSKHCQAIDLSMQITLKHTMEE